MCSLNHKTGEFHHKEDSVIQLHPFFPTYRGEIYFMHREKSLIESKTDRIVQSRLSCSEVWPVGAAIQITRGITLAGKFDLIKIGVALENLISIKCIFQECNKKKDRKCAGERGLDESAAVTEVSEKKDPEHERTVRQERERDESGSSIYNAVMKLSDGGSMQRCLAHI